MKHIIFGGDGFVGRYLAQDLINQGKEVIVCDINQSKLPIYPEAKFIKLDITKIEEFHALEIQPNDVVYHLAARQYDRNIPRRNRREYFEAVNCVGTANILEYLNQQGGRNLIYFSTDMVYGKPLKLPVDINHPRNPYGPYGQSKRKSEDLCKLYRDEGINITIFRPRLIIGPGRLGVLGKLFFLINKNLPVPMIGDGSNHYQMVSVFDCVSAIQLAVSKGIPNQEYNLGSKAPPSVEELLGSFIKRVRSNSILLKTPGGLIKQILKFLDNVGLTLMYEEQFMIADENYIVDISKTENELGWQPDYQDDEMIYQAFNEYKNRLSPVPKARHESTVK
ncbi:MAG: NAD(P)-dependent oxidoreductase [Nostoc sp. ChiSLP02]|nr:NAD(P)-dependent oxidoreductase [Nostoc sp. DedSLP05]MDZ8097881.1 NAD(P)-dependent oxidoreductase [Nostoc sp. DedSLP01]MDZ8183967.1 NAD(P)-dependent oxidoreductase [Nostoc sp. ChiSLP02]